MENRTSTKISKSNSIQSELNSYRHPNGSLICDFSVSTGNSQFINPTLEENAYVFDGVKVEIEDIDNTSISNITTQSLKRCKKQVLKHYYSLLCFIGWRPFYKEHSYHMPCYCILFNILYPIAIIASLFYAYVYEILMSYGKLNLISDKTEFKDYEPFLLVSHRMNVTKGYHTTVTSSGVENRSAFEFTTKSTGKIKPDLNYAHIIIIHIIPSLMHLTSYIMGFIYFRIRENEQLYALMEKVFLSVNQTMKQVSQDKVIKRLKIFIILGVFWIITTMCLHLYHAFSNFETLQKTWPYFTVQVLALFVMYAVYLAVVINHGTQCEMIIFYVQEVKTRLDEKSITIKDAMQQILDTRVSIGNLNSTITKMTTLVSLIFLEKIINVSIMLVAKRPIEAAVWIYWMLNLFSWICILLFSIIQVARLNSECDRFKQIAIASRVYGYHASSRDELDSFLLFVSNARLKGKLCGISFKSSHLLTVTIIVMFIFIILVQTSMMPSII